MQVCAKVGKSRNTVKKHRCEEPDGSKVSGRKVRREKIRRKKMQVCEKVGKSRNTVFFRCVVAPEGRKSKSRLAKAADAETSGEMRNEKLHAVVARSRLWSEKVQNTWVSDHFWKLRYRKSVRRCGAKHISKSKCTKHTMLTPLLQVAMSKKCTPLWRETHFEDFRSENVQNTTCSRRFWRFRCRFAWQAPRIVSLVKSGQNVTVLQHFQKRWQAWGIWRGSSKTHFAWQVPYKRHVHQRCSEVRALISWEGLHFGASDLQFCCDDFAWQVQHVVRPGINFFRGRRSTLHRWSGKIAKRIGARLPALHSTFHFWKSLAEFFRFWCLQFRKMRKSRRLASFRMLSSSRNEDVSQNGFVLAVVMFKHQGILAEFLRFWSCR